MTYRRHSVRLGLTAAVLTVATFVVLAAMAGETGPPLSPPSGDLATALTCSGDFQNGKQPVLLVPGTTQSAETSFSWNYEPALTQQGIPWCAVSPPHYQMSDIQIGAEYVVHGIRTAYQKAGRKIAVVGHSQGGMQPRWALKYWPDTRGMVADLVGLAPANQGVTSFEPLAAACPLTGCPPAVSQEGDRKSKFYAALNSGAQTFPGIDYTVIYTKTDEVVWAHDNVLIPAPGAGYRRIAVQDICPLNVADHLIVGTTDPVAWALTLDAITHDGPADQGRISRMVCTQTTMPGVSLPSAITGPATVAAAAVLMFTRTPPVHAEPPLRCYVTRSC